MADESFHNPYTPPTSDTEDSEDWEDSEADVLVPFPRPLFSPGQALVATIFGGLVAGVIMMQANYRAMGRSSTANKTLLLGLLGTIGVIAIVIALARSVPALPVNIAAALIFYKLFRSRQGELFIINRSAGGARHSNWLVLAITVASFVAFVLIVFAVVGAAMSAGVLR